MVSCLGSIWLAAAQTSAQGGKAAKCFSGTNPGSGLTKRAWTRVQEVSAAAHAWPRFPRCPPAIASLLPNVGTAVPVGLLRGLSLGIILTGLELVISLQFPSPLAPLCCAINLVASGFRLQNSDFVFRTASEQGKSASDIFAHCNSL